MTDRDGGWGEQKKYLLGMSHPGQPEWPPLLTEQWLFEQKEASGRRLGSTGVPAVDRRLQPHFVITPVHAHKQPTLVPAASEGLTWR